MSPVLQIISLLESKMKKSGISIPNVRLDKDGKPVPIDKAPKHVKQAKRAKAERKAKAWKAAGRKTT